MDTPPTRAPVRTAALFAAIALLTSLALLAARAAKASAGDVTTRVSVDGAGGQANGASAEFGHSIGISADGRYVTFESRASNLVAGDTNGVSDIFVHDRETGVTERVSVDSLGGQADSLSAEVAISADGRFVAFDSLASNLVPGDTNGLKDIFVHDRQTGMTERVSVDSSGNQVTGVDESHDPVISANGRFVGFNSQASGFVPGDMNGQSDAFVHDRLTGTTERVSVDSSGAEGNGGSSIGSMSDDGRFVTFSSTSSNLVPNDTNGAFDVFVHDRLTGTTERVSVDSSGGEGNSDSLEPSISGDGRFVAFTSRSSNLVPNDSNGANDVFVHDRTTGNTELVSVDSAGGQGNSDSGAPSISDDGNTIAFFSFGTNLVSSDTNASTDIFVHHRATGLTERASVDSSGGEANGPSPDFLQLSRDGSFVAFASGASNLVPADTNGVSDAFVHGPATSTTTSTSATTTTMPPTTTTTTTTTTSTTTTVFVGCATITCRCPDGSPRTTCVTLPPIPGGTSGCDPAYDANLCGSCCGGPATVTSCISCGGSNDPCPGCLNTCCASTPSPPTDVTAAAGDGRATVTWSPPTSDGGNPITRYTVTSSPVGSTVSVDGTTTSANVYGLTNGTTYTFTVTATNAAGTSDPSSPSNPVTPQADSPPPVTATGTADPASGGQASTGTDPTASQPLATSVDVPPGTSGGDITIAQTTIDQNPPSGYSFLGQQVDITAPAATPGNPLRLVFTLDSSLAPGQTPASIDLFRTEGGVTQGPIPGCTGQGAVPDPCVSSRAYVNGSDIQITILASTASAWNFGVVPYEFSGFFSPVANPPTLNKFNAGATVPVKFSLHGNKGLAIFATAYPKVQPISCATLASVGTLASASGGLTYDNRTDRYTYSWKTAKSWAGSCRQLVVKLNDGTAHPGDFRMTK